MNNQTPEDDAAEQFRDGPTGDEESGELLQEIPFDANEADAAEQTRDVGYDEDDYR